MKLNKIACFIMTTMILCSTALSVSALDGSKTDESADINIINNTAENVIYELLSAMNDHDISRYIETQCEENKTDFERFFTGRDWEKDDAGVMCVENAALYEIKELPLDIASSYTSIYKYEEIYNDLKAYYVGIDYKVKNESRYFFNGVNYDLIILGKENDEWKIVEESDAPVESLTLTKYKFGSSAENKALEIVNARLDGIILNGEMQVISSENKENDLSYAKEYKVSDWASEAVDWSKSAGIFIDKKNYKENITREEFATGILQLILYQSDMQQPALYGIYDKYIRSNGLKKPIFKDANENDNVYIAAVLGLIHGYSDGTLRPDNEITREEAAVILKRAYEFYGGKVPEYSGKDLSYADNAMIHDWAKDGAAFVDTFDIMNGTLKGEFKPYEKYTVEQCCATFMRMYDNAPVSRRSGNVKTLLSAKDLEAYIHERDNAGVKNAIVGLFPDGSKGSRAVMYDTDTWRSYDLLDLPDVTSDNYAAMTSDKRYIAYTKWNDTYTCRYLSIYDAKTGITQDYFKDLPYRNEIIKISWLPDDHTLLYILNDQETNPYMEIHTFDVLTEKENVLVKGGLWKILASIDDIDEDFYLKDEKRYQSVKETGVEVFHNNVTGEEHDLEWGYYMTQEDIDRLYQKYGGKGSFDRSLCGGYMYIELSPPRCSPDGNKIIYSASLRRTSAPGSSTPLWMSSSIWEYDMKTGKTEMIYSQDDGGCIGRVEWAGKDRLTFVSYYDFQGSCDDICSIDLKTGKAEILFAHSEENYNNVTLLPINESTILFTSSSRYQLYEESENMILNIIDGKTDRLELLYKNIPVLPQLFCYLKIS